MQNYDKFKNVISINDYSRVRKHRQIVNYVLSATAIGTLKLNDKLPSVNELSIDCNISRDTVVRAYAFLKENGIIDSIPGKGYYIKSVNNDYRTRVFLLFDEMNSYNTKIYDAFSAGIGENALIDFYVYQNDFDQLKEHILYSSIKEYTHYVIVANFDENEFMGFIKSKLPAEKLTLFNKGTSGLNSQITSLYQDFETAFFLALVELNSFLIKYNEIKLVFSKKNIFPEEIKNGFIKFCNEYRYCFSIVENLCDEKIQAHTVYIDFEDDEGLVKLIKRIKAKGLIIGKDVGIISYSDNSLKEILLGGITVITDVFEKIGYQLGRMILKRTNKQIIDPFKVIIRKSL